MITPKLIDKDELKDLHAYQPYICHNGECSNRRCSCRLLAHIAAQKTRIEELERQLKESL